MTPPLACASEPDLRTLRVATHHVRPTLDAIAGSSAARRAFVVGNAGAGKSSVIRHLCALLLEREAPVELLDDDTDVAAVPRSRVLLVDDLHLVDDPRLDALRERSLDSGAGLIAASRPWPRSETVAAISRHLERSRPPIVLGRVSRSDVLSYLSDRDEVLADACVEHVLELTAGVSWLVADALALHDERDCTDDREHVTLRLALQERIAHRLDTVDEDVRRAIETLALATGTQAADASAVRVSDAAIAHGHAEGLLLRSGRPIPVVQWAVRNTISVPRLATLGPGVLDELARTAADGGPGHPDWLSGFGDEQLRSALVARADGTLDADPGRAAVLYGAAVSAGADAAELAVRRARAALAAGELEAASVLLDDALERVNALDGADRDRVADLAGAMWAERGMLLTASDTYAALAPATPESEVRALVCHAGAGLADRFSSPDASAKAGTSAARPSARSGSSPDVPSVELAAAPSTLGVAMRLLDRGLRATLADEPAALTDLVRASELYTSSKTTAPIAEQPAVIAAIVALLHGDPATAHAVVDSALRGGQGGPGARGRLLLWQAWVATQRERPAEARESLAHAVALSGVRSPRDELLLQAVHVSIARRYEDLAGLTAAWTRARESIMHVEFDLYTLLPLAELVTAGARVGDTQPVARHFAQALELVERLGSPALWATHLRWAGIQQGILLNRPDSLTPHARALVAAAARNPVAATMAQAGRVWTSVLAGHVDADVVESAARGLADVGLAWDGARLAGHGAGRATDRKVSSRLLSCARELHPNDALRRDAASGDETTTQDAESAGVVLSDREHDVARLVVQGKTYAEIGEAIFISPRTAEHHIAHIRRRLGATSRSDLIAKLRLIIDRPASPPAPARTPGGAHGFPVTSTDGIGTTPDATIRTPA